MKSSNSNLLCNLHTLLQNYCLSPHHLTKASSGSALGSTPNSKSLAPRPNTAPPSPARIGEDSKASARLGPGGTVTRWEPAPSLPFSVVTKAVSFSVFTSCTGQKDKLCTSRQRTTHHCGWVCVCVYSVCVCMWCWWGKTSSPKLMTSTLTFSFLRRFAILTSYGEIKIVQLKTVEKGCLIVACLIKKT